MNGTLLLAIGVVLGSTQLDVTVLARPDKTTTSMHPVTALGRSRRRTNFNSFQMTA